MNLIKIIVIVGLIFSSTLADPGDESGDDPGNYVADENAGEDDDPILSSILPDSVEGCFINCRLLS